MICWIIYNHVPAANPLRSPLEQMSRFLAPCAAHEFKMRVAFMWQET